MNVMLGGKPQRRVNGANDRQDASWHLVLRWDTDLKQPLPKICGAASSRGQRKSQRGKGDTKVGVGMSLLRLSRC